MAHHSTTVVVVWCGVAAVLVRWCGVVKKKY
jgi:hypothetical protein